MSYLLKLTLSILTLFNCIQAQEQNKNINISQYKIVDKITDKIKEITSSVNKKISNLFSESGSIWIKLFAAFALGFLLSLTPCILPMIPITIGILQINPNTSKFKGFLTALSYTLGVSLIYAIFGFIVALTSYIIGDFQKSIYTMLPLSILLIYFGLSMFGFYEIKIPKFLQPKGNDVKTGSYLSAFTFGLISGTSASACLSPGLTLILDYVSTSTNILNYIQGFLILFMFGIGSSLLLLIIGTFSNSLSILPKPGSWMLEVKKIIGIMLISMAFYHLYKLNKYIPNTFIIFIMFISFIAIGIYYIKSINKSDSKTIKIYKYILGITLILSTLFLSFYKYKFQEKKTHTIWLNNFEEALKKSEKENKLLFIDLGSSFCQACKSIDKSVFENPEIIKYLSDNYIAVKINYDIETESFEKIRDIYGPIKGFPTYIIAKKDNIIKKLGSELGDLKIKDILEILK